MSKDKIKILKKKKVKEIKSKVKIKKVESGIKVKEIKKSNFKLKTNIENSEGELNDEKFSEVLQSSKAPVLEQIAISGGNNLENIVPIRKDGPEESLDVGSDYTQFGNLKDEKNKYKESSPGYDSMTGKDKKDEERRFGETNFEFEARKKEKNIGDYI